MGMSSLLREWTADLLSQLPDDGNRYEVIDGQLFVTPAPSLLHQRALIEMVALLLPYTKKLRLDLLFAPFAVKFSERREVQPDLGVMPRMPDGKFASTFADVGKLLLAVEVLSPYSLRTDRFRKRDLYQSEGVSEYWIVDCESREMERWRPDDEKPQICSTGITWTPVSSHEALVIDVAQYFRDAHREGP